MNIDPVVVLILLSFLAGPLLRGLSKLLGQQGKPTPTTPARPVRRRLPEAKASAPQQPVAETVAFPPTDESDFDRKLAEARRRVSEAQANDAAPRPERPRPVPEQAPTTSHHHSLESAAMPAEPPLIASRYSERGFAEVKTAPLKIERPLRPRQRMTGPKAGKLGGREKLLELDKRAMLSGILWHQILSGPLAKQNGWRTPLRRR